MIWHTDLCVMLMSIGLIEYKQILSIGFDIHSIKKGVSYYVVGICYKISPSGCEMILMRHSLACSQSIYIALAVNITDRSMAVITK